MISCLRAANFYYMSIVSRAQCSVLYRSFFAYGSEQSDKLCSYSYSPLKQMAERGRGGFCKICPNVQVTQLFRIWTHI